MAKRKPRATSRPRPKSETRAEPYPHPDADVVAHHPEDPVEAAREYGVDISQLEESLRLTPAERLARLDANAEAMRELRGAVARSRTAD